MTIGYNDWWSYQLPSQILPKIKE